VAFAKMAAVMAVGIMGGDVEAAAFAAENAARYNSLSTYNQEIPIVERQIEEAENEEQAAFLREYSKTILPDNMRADRAAALPLPEFMQRRITPINASIQETYNETQTFLQSCDQASPILGRMIRNQVWPVELGLKWIRLPTTLGGAIDLGAVVSGAGTGVIRNAGTTITNTLKGSLKSMVSALRGAGTNASRLVPTGLGKPLSLQGANSNHLPSVKPGRISVKGALEAMRSGPNPHPGENVARPDAKRPLGHVRTNGELIQDVATLAERKIGGKGALAGTRKHQYAENLLDRYQKIHGDRGIELEKRWLNGKRWEPGDPLQGTSVLDTRDAASNTVYDYKFVQNPGKGLRPAQIRSIETNAQSGATIQEINPVKPTG
jgi:hypothetical protein